MPGFPVGFGDDEKAGQLLQKALKLNPERHRHELLLRGVPVRQARYTESLQYLDKAAKAAPRPGRELADKGRHAEIAALTAKVKAKMS